MCEEGGSKKTPPIPCNIVVPKGMSFTDAGMGPSARRPGRNTDIAPGLKRAAGVKDGESELEPAKKKPRCVNNSPHLSLKEPPPMVSDVKEPPPDSKDDVSVWEVYDDDDSQPAV